MFALEAKRLLISVESADERMRGISRRVSFSHPGQLPLGMTIIDLGLQSSLSESVKL